MFVYKALLEALQIGETAMPSYEIEARYIELKKDKDGKSITKEQFAVWIITMSLHGLAEALFTRGIVLAHSIVYYSPMPL